MHPLKQNLFLSKIQTQDNTYEINITTKTKKQLFFNKANKLLDRYIPSLFFHDPYKKGNTQ